MALILGAGFLAVPSIQSICYLREICYELVGTDPLVAVSKLALLAAMAAQAPALLNQSQLVCGGITLLRLLTGAMEMSPATEGRLDVSLPSIRPAQTAVTFKFQLLIVYSVLAEVIWKIGEEAASLCC